MSEKEKNLKNIKLETNPEKNRNLRIELSKRFREAREKLRLEWVHEMTNKNLLTGLTEEETEKESATIYDTCINCLETSIYDKAEEYAHRMAERRVLQGMTIEQILGGMLTLRDVYGRTLFKWYKDNIENLLSMLEIYEPVANKILVIIALTFINEQENIVRQQQESILEISTPVLQIREGLLILPIIGTIDTSRARQITEQLLHKIRDTRAKVVVIDITGVPTVDSKVANHLIQTSEAARLMGTKVIFTGISSEIAQTVVTIGVDLSRLHTLCDLQGGIEVADQIIGYTVTKTEENIKTK